MRETGFYWVLFRGKWQPAHYSVTTSWWTILGIEKLFEDVDISEVGKMFEQVP